MGPVNPVINNILGFIILQPLNLLFIILTYSFYHTCFKSLIHGIWCKNCLPYPFLCPCSRDVSTTAVAGNRNWRQGVGTHLQLLSAPCLLTCSDQAKQFQSQKDLSLQRHWSDLTHDIFPQSQMASKDSTALNNLNTWWI